MSSGSSHHCGECPRSPAADWEQLGTELVDPGPLRAGQKMNKEDLVGGNGRWEFMGMGQCQDSQTSRISWIFNWSPGFLKTFKKTLP